MTNLAEHRKKPQGLADFLPWTALVGAGPHGTPNWSTAASTIRFANIYLPAALIDGVAAELPTGSIAGRLRDDLWFVEDGELEALALAYLDRATAAADPATRLELSARTTLLIERLLTRHHGARLAEPVRGDHGAWQQSRTEDLFMADPGADISTATLAALVGLSSTHFARAFKASTGLPPHAWAQRERIGYAAERLAGTTQSIAEIAAFCDFASQQHFTTAFMRATGATLSAWRRERLKSTT